MNAYKYKLSEEEIQNPYIVLSDFFCSYPHSKIKELLWVWIKSTFCKNFSTSLEMEEKAMITDLYERMEKLIDAAYIIRNSGKVI
ncbi:MAG: hypothetical protein J0H85_13630 [Sediminibacterium magnilacihabitans]|jgi:hypothetical protein|nr:hypothetical protein [Sediminibacterium magnilacihabitans]PQV59469.1 hypothetical protein CLV53_11830 [Sediminibacterium magnilacihabitans]